MSTFRYQMEGEDGLRFAYEVEAAGFADADELVEHDYPEAKILSVERIDPLRVRSLSEVAIDDDWTF
jgi:hypothetical protein